MKLKHIFSLLAISGLTIITIAFFLSTKTVENEIVEANVSRQASNVKIVSATLEHASELQKLFLRDYSFWDDMAEAVQKKDTSWLEQEFFGPLEIYSADAVWVVAPEGELLYTNRSTNSTLSLDELAIPFDLASIETHAHQEEISTFFKQDPQTKAVVAYHVGPILYHSQPEKNTKPYGFIIVAVHWNAALLQQLSTLVDATVTIKPANNKDSAYKVQALTQQLRNHEGATIATLEFLFSDTSLLFLSQHFEREMRQMGLLGIMSISITFIVFQTAIIQPINKLIIQLKTVSHSKQSKEMEKKSELTLLSELIEKYGKQIEKISNKNNVI